MATHREVEQQINFALDQLGIKNRHHEFEHICRKFARLRICSNILPATGPVSSGGDQSRDFETYTTHLKKSLGDVGWFLGVAEGPVVFACTLQRDGIAGKVREDVEAICAHEPPPVYVHFFAGVPVTVATRHKLQDWARNQWDVTLEIHDRESLAEHLTEPELFWIASEYLNIPLSLYPEALNEDNTYLDLRQQWSDPENRTFNHASFVEIVQLGRSLLSRPERRTDIGLWLEALEGFFRDEGSPLFLLKERARYEYLVLRLRVQGDLLGKETLVEQALSEACKSDHWQILHDASALCMFSVGASSRGALDLSMESIYRHLKGLVARIDDLLMGDVSPTEKCWLAETRGSLCFRPDQPEETKEVISWWNKVVDLAPSAPLYPITRLSVHLTELAPMLVDLPEYEQLVQRVDEIVGTREGAHTRAQGCMNRGMKLRSAGKRVQSIRELNRGKVFAFYQEYLFQMAGSMLLTANIYEELGCTYAAKYYAMAVVHMAVRQAATHPKLNTLVRPAIIACAQADYVNGSFSQCLDFLELGFRAEQMYEVQEPDPGNADYKRLRMYGAYCLVAASAQPSGLRQRIRRRISSWSDGDVIFAVENEAKKVFDSIPRGVQDGRPVFRRPLFSDLEKTQEICWSGLGIIWRVRWQTSARATVAAEQLVAALQIVTVDLSRWDLYIVPTECNVRIVEDDGIEEEDTLTHEPDNKCARWTLTIVAREPDNPYDRHIRNVAHVITMLGDLSLRPQLFDWFEQAYRDGLANNTFVVDSYSSLLEQLADTHAWLQPAGSGVPVAGPYPTTPELGWNDSLVEEYDPGRIRDLLENRYSRTLLATQKSLPVWLRDAGGADVVTALRRKGWLDWQILGGLAALVVNDRSQGVGDPRTSQGRERIQSETQHLFSNEEDIPLPLSTLRTFDEAHLEMMMEMNAMSTLIGMGLSPRQRTPALSGVLKFLRFKVRFFEDDIEHDDPFDV